MLEGLMNSPTPTILLASEAQSKHRQLKRGESHPLLLGRFQSMLGMPKARMPEACCLVLPATPSHVSANAKGCKAMNTQAILWLIAGNTLQCDP